MMKTSLLIYLIILNALFVIPTYFAQEVKEDPIRLVNWNALDCDNTYDSYRIKNRITNIEKSDGLLKITVNFSENCCAKFEPTIHFEDSILYLVPFTKKSDIYCTCDCCFSIEYEISGLDGTDFDIYFKEKKVEYSENYYDTISPSFQMYKGDTINRTNKYGFSEGKWITFYEDGAVRSVSEYPELVLYHKSYPNWSKHYYQNGNLEEYNSDDTVQVWFEDGTIQYEKYEYTIGDTTFEYTFSRYDNRNVKERSLEKNYPVIFRSKYNDCYKAEGTIFPYVYQETYYENGKTKLRIDTDTTKKWYPNGKLQEISYDSITIKFDSLGRINEKEYYWEGPGNECSKDLSNTLYVKYDNDFSSIEIELNRDEIRGNRLAWGTSYYWKWNAAGVLIKSPENWNEELPWKRFEELEIPTIKK